MSDDPTPGSAAWWNGLGESERKRSLSIERIVSETLAMLDERGLDAVTMRSVALRLDTGAASLYRYVAGREALMLLVVDHVYGLIVESVGDLGRSEWQTVVREAATSTRATLIAHRNAVPLLSMGGHVGPMSMQLQEQIIAELRRAGFTPHVALLAFYTLAQWVVGFVIQECASSYRDSYGELMAERLTALPEDDFPEIHALADDIAAVKADEEFAFGLEVVIVGLAHMHATQHETQA